MKKTTYFLLMLLMLASCVEEYKIPQTVSDIYESEVVVQGRILAGEESVIYVSYTTPFGQEEKVPVVRDAQVTIIGENGYRSEMAEYEPSNTCYIINTRELPDDTQYAIEVKLDGETYQSEYLTIVDSPDINEVTYQKQKEGISIHVTTLAEEGQARHYMWSYEEDWEIHAEMDLIRMVNVIPYYSNRFYTFENPDVNPYYYCWSHTTSRNVNLYSTDELDGNIVKDVKLMEIPISDVRLSYIYSILVKQWTLPESAYIYYKTLESYTESGGSLFAPMPSEIQGNVSCISNPKKKARGYVLASTVKEKRLFIYQSDLKGMGLFYENCYVGYPPNPLYDGWEKGWESRITSNGYVVVSNDGKIHTGAVIYSPECFDCRKTKGATKKRPDFWPNNHE